MSKFMNGLNNDIPSPVEEGVVDSIKNFFGRNKAITVDTSAIKSDINSALQQITSLAKTSEFKKLAKGLYKVSSGSMEVYDEHYKTIGDLNDKRFSEIPIKAGQELHVNIGEIQFWKIFPNKDRLDRSPGAERGDLSPEGKEFDRIVNEFSKALDEKVKSDKYKISIEWLVDWDDNNYDIVFKFVPRNYIKNDNGIKESFSSVSDKEAVQEELFPILTGKELPVKEGTWFDVAAIFGMLGIYAAGTYVKNRFFTKHAKGEKPSVTAEDFKKWLEEHPVDEAERRKVMKEVFPLFKKHFPKDCENGVINNMSGEWYDDKKFITGESNIWDFCFILSTIQGLPYPDTDDIDVESSEYSKLEKKYHSDLRKCKQAVNDELKKKYNGRYEIRLEELDEIDDGDGDEGCCVLIDVKRTKQLAEFYKSKETTKESTEVVSESISSKKVIDDAKENNKLPSDMVKERSMAISLSKLLVKKFFPSKFKSLLDGEGYTSDYYSQYSDYHSFDFLKHKIMGAYLIGSISICRGYVDPDSGFSEEEIDKQFTPDLEKAENKMNEELQKKFPNFKIAFEYFHGNIYSAEREYVSYISLIDTRYCNLNCEFKKEFYNIFKTLSKAREEAEAKKRKEIEKARIPKLSKDKIKEFKARRNSVLKFLKDKLPGIAKKIFPGFDKYLSDMNNSKWLNDYMEAQCTVYDADYVTYAMNYYDKMSNSDKEKYFLDELKTWPRLYEQFQKEGWKNENVREKCWSIFLPTMVFPPLYKKLKEAVDKELKKFKGFTFNPYSFEVTDELTPKKLPYPTEESTTYDPFLDDLGIVTEGWGIAFTRFAVKHNLPFANKLEDKIWEWSESTVNQLTNIPEFKEYILREAPKAYDEAYLRNNNLSINVNADMISEFEEEYEDSEAYHKVDKKNCCFCKKIGKFYVGVFGDKSHIHGVWLLMSDSKNKKIYAKALPAPEKELNKFKYQK